MTGAPQPKEREEAVSASLKATVLTEVVQSGVAEGWPRVEGRCPSCGSSSLFVGLGGFVTCSRLDCADPTAVSDLLQRDEGTR